MRADMERAIEAGLDDRHGKRTGDELRALCPFHAEVKPSFSFNVVKGVFKCQACGEQGGWKTLALKLGIEMRKRGRPKKIQPERIVATYDYHDEAGALLFQTVRFEPKDFRQRRPDATGDWAWNLDGVRRVLYRTPELHQSASSGDVV
jgi:hypothetical protein